jgi:DNA-binding NtrC family response regulator
VAVFNLLEPSAVGVHEGDQPTQRIVMRPSHPRSHSTVVLVADDKPLVHSLVEAILEREGYVLLSARYAMEALRFSPAYTNQTELLLSDVELPTISCATLARQILAERLEMGVVLISGSPAALITTSSSCRNR